MIHSKLFDKPNLHWAPTRARDYIREKNITFQKGVNSYASFFFYLLEII